MQQQQDQKRYKYKLRVKCSIDGCNVGTTKQNGICQKHQQETIEKHRMNAINYYYNKKLGIQCQSKRELLNRINQLENQLQSVQVQ